MNKQFRVAPFENLLFLALYNVASTNRLTVILVMNKKAPINAMAAKTGPSSTSKQRAVSTIVEVISDTLKKGSNRLYLVSVPSRDASMLHIKNEPEDG